MTIETIMLILMLVEGRGHIRQFAVNEEEQAYGALQVRQCVLDDIERVYGRKIALKSCFSMAVAQQVCRMYLQLWGHPDKLGCNTRVIDVVRIWCAGADGPTEVQETAEYVELFRKYKKFYYREMYETEPEGLILEVSW